MAPPDTPARPAPQQGVEGAARRARQPTGLLQFDDAATEEAFMLAFNTSAHVRTAERLFDWTHCGTSLAVAAVHLLHLNSSFQPTRVSKGYATAHAAFGVANALFKRWAARQPGYPRAREAIVCVQQLILTALMLLMCAPRLPPRRRRRRAAPVAAAPRRSESPE
jgi:hypothetical protein